MADFEVDVLLPVYNAKETIGEAVDSLLSQTLSSMRVLLIDDGSREDCALELDRIARSDRRIHLVRQSNGGIVNALNAGLALTSAPFVARQDADDISEPRRFERQLGFLKDNPQVLAVGGGVRHIDAAGRVLQTYFPQQPDLADKRWAPAVEPYIIHPFLMVRREAFVAAGGYRPVHHSEDTDLYWRLIERGRAHNMDEILGDYRLHDQSISGSSTVNGRIMAVFSQLAALSARRREAGVADLDFSRVTLADCKAAGTLEAIIRLAAADLVPAERDFFEISVAAKVLELASYRPWRLDDADCAFLRGQLARAGRVLSRENSRALRKTAMRLGAKMAREGRRAELRGLISPGMAVGVALRLARGMTRFGRAASG